MRLQERRKTNEITTETKKLFAGIRGLFTLSPLIDWLIDSIKPPWNEEIVKHIMQ